MYQLPSSAWANPAHPRRCGADTPAGILHPRPSGSSPQVRGRSHTANDAATSGGLIPAGAGQIPHTRGPAPCRAAHPRRCGADLRGWVKDRPDLGSSPQVRGRFRVDGLTAIRRGLIPAGAGQIAFHTHGRALRRAHPRRCGADEATFLPTPAMPGSSPQVRGRCEHLRRRLLRLGLIPAGAGQIITAMWLWSPWRAHPRRCGADYTSV